MCAKFLICYAAHTGTDNAALAETRKLPKSAEALLTEQNQQIQRMDVQLRRLHNDVQEARGNIRVCCRVRPSLADEEHKEMCDIEYPSEQSITLSSRGLRTTKADFTFDKVFTNMETQERIFKELSQLVQSALDGYHVCIFAYGQTGSGKTFTMEDGDSDDTMGMIPRAIELIFESILTLERLGWRYGVTSSFLEINNEKIIDLLNPKNVDCDIGLKDAKGTDVYVKNVTVEPIYSAKQLKSFMKIAQQNRAVAAMDNNKRTSRSHAVMKICLEAANTSSHEQLAGRTATIAIDPNKLDCCDTTLEFNEVDALLTRYVR